MNTTELKARPRAVAVKRALMKYAEQAMKSPGSIDARIENVKAVQVLAAQFDELDAKIWGGK